MGSGNINTQSAVPSIPGRGLFFAGLAALVFIAVAVRLYQPAGWLGSDDAAYYSAAEHILTGTTITRAHHHYARMMVILPVAVSVAVFGHHTWAVALPMFVASIGCVILVVFLGRLLLGWREGLLAGLIVAVLPYFRVLSTTAFADTQVCFWVAAAVILWAAALRANVYRDGVILFAACGFALGCAVSAKVFAATTCLAIGALLLSDRNLQGFKKLSAIMAAALGGLIFFVAEGMFFSAYAGDFFFSLHAHEQSQSGVPEMAAEQGARALGAMAIVKERLRLFLEVSKSGWGWLGLAFWPAVLVSFFLGRAARCMAVWAAGTYLLIAFAPVRLVEGYQPYPIFHGRHILPACIPFALCAAGVAGLLLQKAMHALPGTIQRLCWPAIAAVVLVAAFANPRELRGFCDRPTGRTGEAIRHLVAANPWNDSALIFMTPSSYWRYRILFPEPLKARLRVAAAHDAPGWWRDVTPDIQGRMAALPDPDDAYLMATPTQLEGAAESWDYGVALPPEDLARWKGAKSLDVIRGADFGYIIVQHGAQGAILELRGNGLWAPRKSDTLAKTSVSQH